MANAALSATIQQVHAASHGLYGAPRVHAELCQGQGLHVGRKRVERLMRQAHLHGVCRGQRGRPRTTQRQLGATVAADLVHRDFRASVPNQLWVADITYLPTYQGFLYLAVVVEAWSRQVVGWSRAGHMRTELVLRALDRSLWNRRPEPGLVVHSDHGSQYTRVAYSSRCRAAGLQISRRSVGDAYDNALCESFFGSLEAELIDRCTWRTHTEARLVVFPYIEGFYNRTRRHSALGYLSPADYERRYATPSTPIAS